MSDMLLQGFPKPVKPAITLGAELDQIRARTVRLERAALGSALAGSRDALGTLRKLILDAAGGAAANAEVEWQRSDECATGSGAIKVPDGLTGEALEAAARQARRRILALRQQAAAHSAAAQSWEVRATELRVAADKLVPDPVAPPEPPRLSPMAEAIAGINAEQEAGA